ncbi:fumarylacetoacetate hydrolase family protein [Salinirarus marinus]|uniref:fumarylacetoacetate hydrolase family protein n=1 Tax=Salinirarus marinus TaxID=3068310 RepID=UPI003C6C6034
MRLARIRTPDGVTTGEYDDGTVRAEDGTYVVGEDADLLAPCEPSVFYCAGRNFGGKIDQMGESDHPDRPDFFVKPPVSLHHPETPIDYPEWCSEFTYAGELAAVVDEACSDLTPAEAEDAIRGYTVLNDLDSLDQDRRTARKAFDGSAPLGPWIETDVDPTAIDMYTDVNGERRQEANTERMLFSPTEIVAFLSERCTLKAGDVVSFGSPPNPGVLEPGDEIEIRYEGVGTLRNTVR